MTSGKHQLFAESLLSALTGSSIPIPGTAGKVYLGFSTTEVALDGSNITEPTNGYARQEISCDANSFTTPANRVIRNTQPIFYPDAITADWNALTHCVLFTASTGGSPIVWGALGQAQLVKVGNAVYFPAQSLAFIEAKTGQNHKGLLYANSHLNLFRGISPAVLSNAYLALGTQNPTIDSNGAVSIGEITIPGYSRLEIPCNEDEFSITAARTCTNVKELRFIKQNLLPDIVSQADADWSPVKSFALYNSSLATDPLYYGIVEKDVVVYEQDILRVGIGKLRIQE